MTHNPNSISFDFEAPRGDKVPPIDPDFTHYHYPDYRVGSQPELPGVEHDELSAMPGVELIEIEGEADE